MGWRYATQEEISLFDHITVSPTKDSGTKGWFSLSSVYLAAIRYAVIQYLWVTVARIDTVVVLYSLFV